VIDVLNERSGLDLGDTDKLYFKQIEATLAVADVGASGPARRCLGAAQITSVSRSRFADAKRPAPVRPAMAAACRRR
jgi:hypothetical protein